MAIKLFLEDRNLEIWMGIYG